MIGTPWPKLEMKGLNVERSVLDARFPYRDCPPLDVVSTSGFLQQVDVMDDVTINQSIPIT